MLEGKAPADADNPADARGIEDIFMPESNKDTGFVPPENRAQ